MAKSDTTKVVSKGVCSFCKGEFEKGKMTQHLKGCKERKSFIAAEETGKSRKPKKSRLFHIIVEGQYLPMYWMHLEMPASLSLFELDGFLRDIWLECCGHMSAFNVGKVSYTSTSEEDMFWGMQPILMDGAESNGQDTAGAQNAQDGQDAEDEGDEEGEGSWQEKASAKVLAETPPEYRDRVAAVFQAEFPNPEEEMTELEFSTRLIRLFKALLEPDPNVPPLPAEMQAEMLKILEGIQMEIVMAAFMESMEDRMPQEKDIDTPLEEALTVGQKFTHEYDFGSTTYLKLRVVSEREGVAHKGRNAIQILARNLSPEIPCRKCGKPSVVAEPGGYNIWDSALCKQCAKKDRSEWGYEEMLPIVNSPRTGVCGYTGD